jgi:folate-binding protein YgfZ
LLEADSAAITNIIDTFGRTVPPLFARVERLDGQLAVLGVYGPAAGRIIADVMGVASTVPVDDSVFASFGDAELILLRTDRASVEGWDIIVASDQVEALRGALEAAGAIPGDIETLDVLRVEAGRPRWGAELTEDVIPLEAGLMDRAISTTKGCYTGQEVIIRILHRGHVNRHLRGLRLVSGAAAAGQELFHPEIRPGKPVGTVTSAASSPRLGAIALGYVRREIEPGATVHVGSPDGPPAAVVELPFRIPD